MPTNTYNPIASYTITGSESTYTFTNIPGTYNDLVLTTLATGATGNLELGIRFNGDTGSNYKYSILYASNTSYATSNGTGTNAIGTYFRTGKSMMYANINGYKNTSFWKTINSFEGSTGPQVGQWFNIWKNPAAITSITVFTTSSVIPVGTTFTLYGL
jgi:hypothetical protein